MVIFMLKDTILNAYKSNLLKRFDGDFNFYFGPKDFPNLIVKPYEFISNKGDTLRGNFYCYDGHKENHLIVFDHGMGSGHTAYFREIELLASKGYMVYSYDHTGCMESDGKHANGFLTSLADLDSCLNAIKRDFPHYKISVVGHSWGGFSTSNIAAFHPDVLHVISLAPFISLEAIVGQTFSGLLGFMRKPVIELEASYNPEYVSANAIDALKNYQGHALIIHSKDDNVLNVKLHFDKLKKALYLKENINLVLVDKKAHNPNYTVEAVTLLKAFLKEKSKLMKKGLLDTKEAQEVFINKFDWWKITEQDNEIWNMILETLSK